MDITVVTTVSVSNIEVVIIVNMVDIKVQVIRAAIDDTIINIKITITIIVDSLISS